MIVQHELEEDWLNNATKTVIDTSRMRFETVAEMSALKAMRPDDEGTLAMKLASANVASALSGVC